MTEYIISQYQLCGLLFIGSYLICVLVGRHLRQHGAKKHLVYAMISLSLSFWSIADSPREKPYHPTVTRFVRFKKEWAQWTHDVRMQWQAMLSMVVQQFGHVQQIEQSVSAITNAIPSTAPPLALQLHADILDNPNNANFKARPTSLTSDGHGTWTVEVTASRNVTDEPALMMYLRRRSDGATWWVEHHATSFPTNSNPNAYTYSFKTPIDVEGHLVIADEVLLGGRNGLVVDGLALVDLDSGSIFEGISGAYILEGGARVTIKNGMFMLESSTSASSELEAQAAVVPMCAGHSIDGLGGKQHQAPLLTPLLSPLAPPTPPKLSMSPVD